MQTLPHIIPSQERCHPLLLWLCYCWLDDRKAIQAVEATASTVPENLLLVFRTKLEQLAASSSGKQQEI